MTISSFDSTVLLGYRLSIVQQIWIGLLLPAIFSFTVYVLDVATSVALAWRHFKEQNYIWALFTTLFIYLPSFAFFIHNISKPHLWEENRSLRNSFVWFSIQLLHMIAFPAWTVYRYAKQIFWSVEALLQKGEEQQAALEIAKKPSRLNLYCFLQAFLQSAPQALLQTYLLLKKFDNQIETDYMHITCIVSSLLMLSITTASFQSFESQRVIGRKKPWALRQWTETRQRILEENGHNKQQERKTSEIITENLGTQYTISSQLQLAFNVDTDIATGKNQQYQSHDKQSQMNIDPAQTDSEPSTPYLQPQSMRITSTTWNKDCDYENKMGGADLSNNKHNVSPNENTDLQQQKSTREGEHTTNFLLSPPLEHAPPPPLEDNSNELASFQSHLSQPITQMRKHSISTAEKLQMRGLKLDDPAGLFVAVLWWFFFSLSRILALATLAQLYPLTTIGLCTAQYVITISILLYKNISSIQTILAQLCLGYIYLFCLIEFKTRFRRIILSYIAYFIILNAEDIIITTIWYFSVELEGWWDMYVYFLMIGSFLLSTLCFVYYLSIFKPKLVKMYDTQ